MNELEIAKLAEYAEIDGTELGELLVLLIQMHGYESHLTNEFFKSLNLEMKKQLDWFKENTEIIQREIIKTHTIKELDYSM